jgi:hypothetical protein
MTIDSTGTAASAIASWGSMSSKLCCERWVSLGMSWQFDPLVTNFSGPLFCTPVFYYLLDPTIIADRSTTFLCNMGKYQQFSFTSPRTWILICRNLESCILQLPYAILLHTLPIHFLLLSVCIPCLPKHRMMVHVRFTYLSFHESTCTTHTVKVEAAGSFTMLEAVCQTVLKLAAGSSAVVHWIL